jgi:DtxR family transcriptional regulator, manganese transport regulator
MLHIICHVPNVNSPYILHTDQHFDGDPRMCSRWVSEGNSGEAMATTAAPDKARKARHEPDDGDLPAELTQARRFGKTRSAQSGALLEDYVELIADLLASAGEARPTDIARRLGVSHATAIKTISRLKRAGMATARPYRGVFLTEAGQALAQRVRARHRLVVGVLRALGVPAEAAEADAEGIEHYVSETTLKAFARFLQSRQQP